MYRLSLKKRILILQLQPISTLITKNSIVCRHTAKKVTGPSIFAKLSEKAPSSKKKKTQVYNVCIKATTIYLLYRGVGSPVAVV